MLCGAQCPQQGALGDNSTYHRQEEEGVTESRVFNTCVVNMYVGNMSPMHQKRLLLA